MGFRFIFDIGEGMGTIQVDDDKRKSLVYLLHYLELEQQHVVNLQKLLKPIYAGKDLTEREDRLVTKLLKYICTTHKATLKELERLLEDD